MVRGIHCVLGSLLISCGAFGGGVTPDTITPPPSSDSQAPLSPTPNEPTPAASSPDDSSPDGSTPGATAAPTQAATPAPTPEPTAPPPSTSALRVGAAWESLLPLVNGTLDYAAEVRQTPPNLDPADTSDDPGVFVRAWDVGTIAIGNGFPTSHWVHDDIRVAAAAFEDTTRQDGQILVMVTADLYMLFRQDLQAVGEKLPALLGEALSDRVYLVIAASHNHQGPDTAGLSQPINHDAYDHMTSQMARAVAAAVEGRRPARVKVASSRYQFGSGDGEAPLIMDPALGSLQAVDAGTGEVLVTLVQWAAHPETTLWLSAPVTNQAHCEYLQAIGEAYEYDDGDDATYTCTIEGQYITADFPGYMAWHLMQSTGAPALYFNGAVGSMISTLNAQAWETEGRSGEPVGDGVTIPPGATVLPKGFRKIAVIGKELARRVEADLAEGRWMEDLTIDTAMQTFKTPLTNVGFRVGLVVKQRSFEPVLLGDRPRELFVCQPGGVECVSDAFASEPDPVLGVPRRVGDWLESEVHYLRLGEVGILTVPGELVPELGYGLPSDFYSNISYFYPEARDTQEHASGEDYTILGWVKSAMPEPHRWLLGLTPDELGYFVPVSDWRIWCVADEDEVFGLTTSCQQLYDEGIIDYPDGVAGQRCKDITDNPSLLQEMSGEQADALRLSCTYGQTFGEVPGHYVQTVAAGWDMVEDYFAVVRELTWYTAPWTQINPEFEAVNQQR